MLRSLTSLFGMGVDDEKVSERKSRELKELAEQRLYEWGRLVACVEEYCYKEKRGFKAARCATTTEGKRASIYGGLRRRVQRERRVDGDGTLSGKNCTFEVKASKVGDGGSL